MRLASLAHLAVVLTVTSVLGCDDTNPTSSAGGSTSASTSTSVTGTTSGTTSSVASSTGAGMVTTDFTAGGDRPTTVFVPPNYDATKPAPLLILLHGYTASDAIQKTYLKVKAVAQAHGMDGVEPFTFTGIRFLLGVCIVAPFAWRDWRSISRREVPPGRAARAVLDALRDAA